MEKRFIQVDASFFVWLVLVFRDRVSLCSLGCPGTRSVDQAGLELTKIHLPLPPHVGSKGLHHHLSSECYISLANME